MKTDVFGVSVTSMLSLKQLVRFLLRSPIQHVCKHTLLKRERSMLYKGILVAAIFVLPTYALAQSSGLRSGEPISGLRSGEPISGLRNGDPRSGVGAATNSGTGVSTPDQFISTNGPFSPNTSFAPNTSNTTNTPFTPNSGGR